MELHDWIAWGFRILWGALILYWIINAFGNKQTAQRVIPIWRRAMLLVALLLLLLRRNHPSWYDRRFYMPSLACAEVGLALALLGVALAIWARRVLGKNWSGNPTIKVDHELIQSGPYAIVRHPIYTGLLIAIFGSLMPDGRIADFGVFALFVALLTFKLKLEEGLMRQQFPEAYPEYCRRTYALVPYVF